MSQNSLVDTEALKAALWKKLDTLPHRDVIEKSDASQWIDFMANHMPDDAMWHMIRAGGVGGSEIGGLVRNFMGHRADHGFSAHDWALSKLLRKTPEQATGVLRRGHDMEPLHATRFYKEYGTNRDMNAYNQLSGAQGKAIWMRYSPDDVVYFDTPTVFSTVDGEFVLEKRVLVDYKAPTEVDSSARIAFQYACQLHQGAVLCQEQGIELHGAMLSQFDWASWSLKNDFVEIDQDLCQLITQAGDHYWDFVMNGRIPQYVVKGRLELDPDLREAFAKAAERLGAVNAMKTQLDKASKELKDFLADGLDFENHRFDGQTIVYPGAIKVSAPQGIDEDKVRKLLGEDELERLLAKQPEVKGFSDEVREAVAQILGDKALAGLSTKNTSTQYDAKAMLDKLQELKIDVKPFRKMTRLDPAKVFDALIEAGHDPEDCIAENVRVTVDPAMKARAEQWFEASFPALEAPAVTRKDQREELREVNEAQPETQQLDRPVRERISA